MSSWLVVRKGTDKEGVMDNLLWLPLALGSALSVSLADLTVKRFFADLSPYTMCLARAG